MSSLRHLRSSTAAKRPVASGIADGQLAINTASGTPGLFFKNNASGVVKIGPAHVGTTAPNAVPAGSSGHSVGEMWLDTAIAPSGLKVWNGSDWFVVNPSGTTTTLGVVQFATVSETQSGVTNVRAVTPSGLQSKLSDSTSTTSSTTIASSTAVKTAFDRANSAIQASGGTMTGPLEIGPSGSIIFEGSGVNTFQTTINVIDPGTDRTITFPDISGNVVTTGDSGTITGTMISGLTITNANIATSAAIVDSKLATISGADKVSLLALNIDGATDIGAAIEDADLLIVDDGGGGTNRRANASRLPLYVFSKTSGDATISASGVVAISSGAIVDGDINANAAIALSKLATGALPTGITISSGNIVDGTIANADINTNAAIAYSKLASLSSGNILIGSSGNVATSTAISGDITITSAGVTAIASGVITDADIGANAAIGLSKLATGALPTGITISSGNIVDGTIGNLDISASAAIAHSKLASITAGSVLLGNASGVPTATALSGDVTISSLGVVAIASGAIVDAEINANAAIALSKLATGALPAAITVSSGNIVDGTIGNAEINASAAIAFSKLATGALPTTITVSSGNIVDGTIGNAEISATAAIVDTKLATISTASKVSNSATTATSANTASAIVARDASGNFNTTSINSGPLAGMRNRIMNGDMRIDQRNAGVAVSVNNARLFTLDRWQSGVISSAGPIAYAGSFQQVADAPAGYVSSLKFTTTTAQATAVATHEVYVFQPIEGQNIADLALGTASALTVTISFWVKSSLTGTFSGFLRSQDNGSPPAFRSYVFNYTVSAANTWEKKTVTITGDTSNAITVHTGSGTGLGVLFDLGSGSSFEQAAGSWQTANKYRSSGSVRVIGTLNATWQVTGVQLEPGSVATPFECRPIGTELALCQRYYYRITATAVAQRLGVGFSASTTTATALTTFPVTMRAAPSSLEQSGTAGDYGVGLPGSSTTCSAVPTLEIASASSGASVFTVASGLTSGGGIFLRASNTNAFLGWSAEL